MDISKLSYEKKIQLAQNANTPVAVLAALAKDEDPYVRREVAWNPNTPVEALAEVLSVELRGNRRNDTLRYIFKHKNATDAIRAIIKIVFPGVQ